jgi:hypothetical protein
MFVIHDRIREEPFSAAVGSIDPIVQEVCQRYCRGAELEVKMMFCVLALGSIPIGYNKCL